MMIFRASRLFLKEHEMASTVRKYLLFLLLRRGFSPASSTPLLEKSTYRAWQRYFQFLKYIDYTIVMVQCPIEYW